MGNSVHRLFCFRAARPGCAEATEFPSPAVDDAEIDVGDAKDPVAAVGLGDADGFAGKRFADEDALARHLMEPSVRTRRTACQASYRSRPGVRGRSSARGARAPRAVVGQAPHGGSCGCSPGGSGRSGLVAGLRLRPAAWRSRPSRSDACARAARSAGVGPARSVPARCRP